MFITANGGTVSNCVIRNGRGLSNWGSGGGGVGMYGGLVTHCVISNNASHTNKGGAGAYVDGGTLATRSSPAMRSTVAALRTTAAL